MTNLFAWRTFPEDCQQRWYFVDFFLCIWFRTLNNAIVLKWVDQSDLSRVFCRKFIKRFAIFTWSFTYFDLKILSYPTVSFKKQFGYKKSIHWIFYVYLAKIHSLVRFIQSLVRFYQFLKTQLSQDLPF